MLECRGQPVWENWTETLGTDPRTEAATAFVSALSRDVQTRYSLGIVTDGDRLASNEKKGFYSVFSPFTLGVRDSKLTNGKSPCSHHHHQSKSFHDPDLFVKSRRQFWSRLCTVFSTTANLSREVLGRILCS